MPDNDKKFIMVTKKFNETAEGTKPSEGYY